MRDLPVPYLFGSLLPSLLACLDLCDMCLCYAACPVTFGQ